VFSTVARAGGVSVIGAGEAASTVGGVGELDAREKTPQAQSKSKITGRIRSVAFIFDSLEKEIRPAFVGQTGSYLFIQRRNIAFGQALGAGFEYTAHDLAGTRFGQFVNKGNIFRAGDGA